jgi:hypothetical protein
MGFFSDLWSSIKSTVGTVYEGIKKGVDWVGEKVQPIVKTVGDVASYIPVIGAPIAGVAQQINKGIDVVRGTVGKVGDVGKSIGLLKQNKYSRAMM